MVDEIKLHDIFEDYYNHKTSDFYQKAKYKNLNLRQDRRGLFIWGSLHKLSKGNNLEKVTFKDYKDSLIELGEYLGIDIFDCKVFRIDFAKNFEMDYDVALYLQHFGRCNYLERSEYKRGLLYRNKQRAFTLYDKLEEMKKNNKKHKNKILESFAGKNILRVEAQFKKRISKRFKKDACTKEKDNCVKVRDLFDKSFYKKVELEWYELYQSIIKYRGKKRIELVKHVKDIKTIVSYLAMVGIDKIGKKEVFQLLEGSKGVITNKQYQRIKSKIIDLIKIQNNLVQDSLIDELDKKVKLSMSE